MHPLRCRSARKGLRNGSVQRRAARDRAAGACGRKSHSNCSSACRARVTTDRSGGAPIPRLKDVQGNCEKKRGRVRSLGKHASRVQQSKGEVGIARARSDPWIQVDSETGVHAAGCQSCMERRLQNHLHAPEPPGRATTLRGKSGMDFGVLLALQLTRTAPAAMLCLFTFCESPTRLCCVCPSCRVSTVLDASDIFKVPLYIQPPVSAVGENKY